MDTNKHEVGVEETTTDRADDTDQESHRLHRFSLIGSQSDGFLDRSLITSASAIRDIRAIELMGLAR